MEVQRPEVGQAIGSTLARHFAITCAGEQESVDLVLQNSSLECSICLNAVDEVLGAFTQDGQVYHKNCIEAWFSQRRRKCQPCTSPATNYVLESTSLVSLMLAKEIVGTYIQERPELKKAFKPNSDTERFDLDEQLEHLQADLAESRNENIRLRSAIEQDLGKCVGLGQKIGQLQAELVAMQSKNEDVHSTSVAGEHLRKTHVRLRSALGSLDLSSMAAAQGSASSNSREPLQIHAADEASDDLPSTSVEQKPVSISSEMAFQSLGRRSTLTMIAVVCYDWQFVFMCLVFDLMWHNRHWISFVSRRMNMMKFLEDVILDLYVYLFSSRRLASTRF